MPSTPITPPSAAAAGSPPVASPVEPTTATATAAGTSGGSAASPPPAPAAGTSSALGVFLGIGGSLPEDPIAALFDAATATVMSASSSLGSNLLSVAPGQTPKILKPRADVEQGVLAMAQVLTSFPTIASNISPTTMVAGVAQVQAAYRLVGALQIFTTAVEDTAKVTLNGIWKDARDGYHNASRVAKDSKAVARSILPLQAMFAKAPRDTTAVVTAATDAVKVVKSNTRATKANTKLAASRQRATVVAPDALNELEQSAASTSPAPTASASAPTAPATAPATSGTRPSGSGTPTG